ncbi:MAG TPA: SPOR domain-containing protein [Mucilaginibacter sp.]|jgi:cell division septation protein DedD|nr:SPOR domain-containing protein [Mucilaginibacter sp.]
MNLADYLSELLVQRNEVSIPGLGHFQRVRINGYYNDQEAKFYPPGHQVKFVPGEKEDDTFAEYIAGKKSISLASSKYFTEKFVSKLKEDAAEGSVAFSDLGSFQTEGDQLVFKPNDTIGNDPSFYGYEPVGVSKPAQTYTEEPAFTMLSEPEPDEAYVSPVETTEEQQYIDGEAEGKKLLNIWLVLLIVITIVVFGLFGAYRYYPDTINRFNPFYHAAVLKKAKVVPVAPVVIHKVDTDTTKKAVAAADTSVKTNAVTTPVATQQVKTTDTLNQTGYVIQVDAFKGQRMAEDLVNHFKKLGLEARIMPRAPRHFYVVTIGRYATHKDAEIAKEELVKAKKLRKDAQITLITPKK